MNLSNNQGPTKLETELQTMISGLTSSTTTLLASVVLLGASLSKAEVIVKLRAYLQVLTAVTAARQTYAAAITARKGASTEIHAFYEGLVSIVKQAIGPTNQGQLATFGIQPPKPRKAPSAETKTLALVKRAATRTARGIMGKQQKQAIKPITNVALQVVGADGKPYSPSLTSSVPAPSSSLSVTSSSTSPSLSSASTPVTPVVEPLPIVAPTTTSTGSNHTS